MKRTFKFGIMILFFTTILSGCCIKHEWQDANCTMPKTCIKCAETEGEALGHKWEEATCTLPKRCSICGETEGEALGHQLSEATYQQAPVCKVCEETVGEALKPYFVENSINVETEPKDCVVPVTLYNTQDISIQKTIDNNWTILNCYSEPSNIDGFKTVHLEIEYEWVTIKDINIDNYIYQWSIFDYYSGKDLAVAKDDSKYGNSIDYDGEKYDIEFQVEIKDYTNNIDWSKYDNIPDMSSCWTSAYMYTVSCEVPEDYDGLVLGILGVNGVDQGIIDQNNSFLVPNNSGGSLYFRLNPKSNE